ncbi:hypothetical protein L1987_16970 [Smallanthus sonchifolius]|uniref:Uncharacterized protein n=1 Tax=Smallanthus sonchifolius TaxID=185202 RepID=A0ACB9IX49_9ASTR|nr:hypothetical protein L1987_16970 [Smallanthus sonchifolius]
MRENGHRQWSMLRPCSASTLISHFGPFLPSLSTPADGATRHRKLEAAQICTKQRLPFSDSEIRLKFNSLMPTDDGAKKDIPRRWDGEVDGIVMN